HAWADMYRGIRAANIAIKNLSSPRFQNANGIVDRLMGEAKFMRAFFYHQLVRFYGAVPLVDRPYELGEPDYELARNTMEECINFIVKDCDEAAAHFGDRSVEKGRATKAAALALKSRIL